MAYHPKQLLRWGMNMFLAKEIVKNYPFLVANLPTASSYQYRRGIIVTDAAATTYNATIAASGATVSGGGSNIVPVWSDGVNWRIG